MRTSITVKFYFDTESCNWSFTSDDPAITGGGDRTPERAARHFASALAFTLQCEREDAEAARQDALAETTARAG